MFDFSSSSSSSTAQYRTKTITIAYADAPSFDDVTLGSDESSSGSSASLRTPTTLGSGRSLLDQLEKEQETAKLFGYYPIWRSMSLSEGVKMETLQYFMDCKLFQLFNFLMTHLLAHTPDDPVAFLTDLVDRCIKYRDEDGAPPLVFEDSHILSVYVALDPLVDGSISYGQYLAGMQTLGVTDFNVLPDEVDGSQKNVGKGVFMQEAKNALVKQINELLGKDRNVSWMDVMEGAVDYDNCSMSAAVTPEK